MSSGTLGVLRTPAAIWLSSRLTYFSSRFSVDALRSIIISQRLLGTREIAVVRHTDCGMVRFESDQLRKVIKAAEPGNPAVAEAVDQIDFLTFKNLEESVKHEVKYLQENPLVLKETTVTGWIYDVRTGRVSQRLCFSSHPVTLSVLYRSRKLFNSCQRDNWAWLIHDQCTCIC